MTADQDAATTAAELHGALINLIYSYAGTLMYGSAGMRAEAEDSITLAAERVAANRAAEARASERQRIRGALRDQGSLIAVDWLLNLLEGDPS